MATVGDQTFNYALGTVHFSGQLTTFDAEYTLTGPAVHYLAELHGCAAFPILDQDIGALQNKAIMLDTEIAEQPTVEAFVAILDRLSQNASIKAPPQITEALHQIETRNGVIRIADLAQDLGMGDRQFHRQFLRVVGIPPKTFAVCQRILTALKLRTETPDMPISDVAYAAGFSDQSHLTRMFKQYMRTTPAKVEFDSDGVLRSLVAKA
ncbi:helix-turn-helix domain-containing protein [Celeribacter sp.]|uniref:AraC family transcriptional regulator n=1 Tax=Celeribacter sp. TaxID=1890673 RepID=UPI003A8D0317